MTTPADADGSEDVADFLERIRDLGDGNQKEDEERTRKLEEDILQARKERQARRAGRSILKGTAPTFVLLIGIQSVLDRYPPPKTLLSALPS